MALGFVMGWKMRSRMSSAAFPVIAIESGYRISRVAELPVRP
jgi:hypothetical protein